jgi:hypothetical protein
MKRFAFFISAIHIAMFALVAVAAEAPAAKVDPVKVDAVPAVLPYEQPFPHSTGVQLLQHCEQVDEVVSRLRCDYYVQGVADLATIPQAGRRMACIPQGQNRSQLMEIALRALKAAKPEKLEKESAAGLILQEFALSFPCAVAAPPPAKAAAQPAKAAAQPAKVAAPAVTIEKQLETLQMLLKKNKKKREALEEQQNTLLEAQKKQAVKTPE